MKHWKELSRQYALELRKHVRKGLGANLAAARELGHEAVRLGLETLDVARIHAGALAALKASGGRSGISKRAGIFFTEAITPLEESHSAARASVRESDLNEALGRRRTNLTDANRALRLVISRREKVEAELRKGGKHCAKLLRESNQLQNHWRHLTRQALSAQEVERSKISGELRDGIAQTLLGINVHLLSVKQAARGNTTTLKKVIAGTERLVKQSVQTINRFARELDLMGGGDGSRHPVAARKQNVYHAPLKKETKPSAAEKEHGK